MSIFFSTGFWNNRRKDGAAFLGFRQGVAGRKAGFTLVEILVSIAILTLLMLVMTSLTDSTQRTWRYTSSKIEQFRDAREAFESITRKLSQATLNTYWDYQRDAAGNPLTTVGTNNYARQSELRFRCGESVALAPSLSGASVTHAVFFQAPFGFANDESYSNLTNLLNSWGYYIEFGDDSASRPAFFSNISSGPAPRYRFRLMEMMEPAEHLTLYAYTSGSNASGASKNAQYTGNEWFTTPLASGSNSRVLAENIVALVLLPKLASQDDPTGAALAPSYGYDSASTGAAAALSGTAAAAVNSKNQLPPVMQVTLVAVDEVSYKRFQTGAAMPNLGLGNLFKTVGDLTDASKPGYAKDLKTLTDTLQRNRINYRVFSTNVPINAARWSSEQQN